MTESPIPAPELNPELRSIREFLGECIPFDQLSPAELDRVAAVMEIGYHRQGHVFQPHDDGGGLRIMRSGAAELRADNGRLMDRFGEGASFNLLGLSQEESGISATLIEDSLLYLLPEEEYQKIRQQHRDFDRFFRSQRSRRVRRAARHEPSPNEMMRRVRDLMTKTLLTVSPEDSIQATARIMTEGRVSSVMVMAGDQLQGIVTDRDLRSRAVAEGLDLMLPVEQVMTRDPEVIEADATLFDATLFMTQKGYHHIPVLDQGMVRGIITASDLMLARQDDPVYLVQHIGRQNSVAELRDIVSQMPNLLVQWVKSGIKSSQVGHVLTAISDAVTVRLIELAEDELGESPVPYCWLGFGSQGRGEQLLGADQDNGLLIDDAVSAQDAKWFEALAHRVSDGLNACGYVYCPGKVMATTDEWRQNLGGWKATVDRWTRTPTADAVMRVSIFFDLRAVYGDASLCQKLQQHMLKQAGSNTIFLAALAENVLDTPPPLGIFRRFVVEHNGEHRDELNLKKRAVIPIVDIVRIHALANGVTAVNTHDRLAALAKLKALSINDSRNLQDALEVIMQTRVEAQVQHLLSGRKPSNYLNPDELPKLVRKQLRDAFGIVVDAQQAVKLRYRPGL